jgi:hypothetical protein
MSRHTFYTYISLVTIFFSFCTFQSSKPVRGVALVRSIPTGYKEDGQAFHLFDTVFLYFFGDTSVYKLQTTIDDATSRNLEGTEAYFVRRVGEQSGLLFKSVNDTGRGQLLPADSFLVQKGHGGWSMTYPKEPDKSEMKKITMKTPDGQTVKFMPQKTPGQNNPDTMFFYFLSNFPKTNYSISKVLDSLTNMKLVKLRLLYNPTFSNEQNRMLPSYEFTFELVALTNEIPNDVNKVYRHFARLKP